MARTDVRELMTAPVMTVEASETLAEIGWAMDEKDIKSLAVVDDECDATGIITSTDFIRMAADETDPTAATVGEYMTEDVTTLPSDASVEAAAEELLSGGFNHAPVVDDGVVGMVSTTDLLTELVHEDEPPAAESE